MSSDATTANRDSGPSRRSFVHGAGWAAPVVVAAAAAPSLAASLCADTTLDFTQATYTRESGASAYYTFPDPLGLGSDLVMRLTRSTFRPSYGIAARGLKLGSTSLTRRPSPSSGIARQGVHLSVGGHGNGRQGHAGAETVISFAYAGAPVTVNDLDFVIGDIDGQNTGEEHLYIPRGTRPTSAQIQNSNWVRGQGLPSNKWRPATNTARLVDNATDNRGSVAMKYAAVQETVLRFEANLASTTDHQQEVLFIPQQVMLTCEAVGR